MRTNTNTFITIAVALVIAAVIAVTVRRAPRPDTLATETIPSQETSEIERLTAFFGERLPTGDGQLWSLRGAAAKIHGCARANFAVVDNLDASLQSSVFRPGAHYVAWLRFANSGGPGHDGSPDLHSLAIKLMEVPGEKLVAGEPAQDFLLFSHPVFPFRNVKAYADGFEGFRRGHPGRLLYASLIPQFKAFHIARRLLREHEDLLATRWWSVFPFQYGHGRAAKFSIQPCRRIDANRRHYDENFLADRLADSLAEPGACLQFMAQLQSDPVTMPIEDATIEWDELIAPFQPLAVITLPPQHIGSDSTRAACRDLHFDPWRGTPEHRPLGGINRARRVINGSAARLERPSFDLTTP